MRNTNDLRFHEVTDAEIIELYWRRDEKAIQHTQQKYGGICTMISNHILDNPLDVEECLSDMYLAAWNTIPPQRPDSMKNYLCKIIRRISINRVNFNCAEKRDSRKTVSFESIEAQLADVFDDDRLVSDEEGLSEAIEKYLAGIPQKRRIVLVLRFWHCISIREISDKTGMNTNTVKSILARELRRMKTFFVKEGVYI